MFQAILGIQDLGQFYHKPIIGNNGTLVFCTTRHVKSTKVISAMNVKWVPLSKLKEKKNIPARKNLSLVQVFSDGNEYCQFSRQHYCMTLCYDM